jgi:hypothetical protein
VHHVPNRAAEAGQAAAAGQVLARAGSGEVQSAGCRACGVERRLSREAQAAWGGQAIESVLVSDETVAAFADDADEILAIERTK